MQCGRGPEGGGCRDWNGRLEGWGGDKLEPLCGCVLSGAGGAPESKLGRQMKPGCELCEMVPTSKDSWAKQTSQRYQITHFHQFGEEADRHGISSTTPQTQCCLSAFSLGSGIDEVIPNPYIILVAGASCSHRLILYALWQMHNDYKLPHGL